MIWSKVDGATGYKVYMRLIQGKSTDTVMPSKPTATTKSTSYVKALSPEKKYNVWNADKLNKELKQQQNITLQEFSKKPEPAKKRIERFSRMDKQQGLQARRFVLETRNNVVQAKKILTMLESTERN